MIFKKLSINNISLNNRVVVGPMCQYSAINSLPSDWHFNHLKKLSQLGAGALWLESIFPSKKSSITKKDLVLSNKLELNQIKYLLKQIKQISNLPLCFQISHAGKKGSSHIPWEKFNTPLKSKEGSWQTYAPSSIKRSKSWPKPLELTLKKIMEIKKLFINSAKLANKAGFEILEIHMAHGYLLHQFFSPISNIRDDQYGGSLQKRSRFLLEIAEEVRKVWPKEKALGARVTADDCLQGGISMDDCNYLVNELKLLGYDFVTPASGGIIPYTNKKIKSCYQVKYCYQIKKKINIKVYANGMIRSEREINDILLNKYADFVAVCKPFINDPYWLYRIAKKNNSNFIIPNQYSRCF